MDVTWASCLVEDCQGAKFGAGGECLAHMSAEALGERLSVSESPVDLDGRRVHFDRQSLARVLDAIPLRSGRRCLGTVRFDGAAFQHQATFDETTFAGPASFAGAAFSAGARFGGATFESDASFEEATFTDQGWFVESHFRHTVSFSNASFSGSAWFQRAVFNSAKFDGALFSGNANFVSSTFSAVSTFSRALFQCHAEFDKATFAFASSWEGARFSMEGQGPPAAVRAPEVVKWVPTFNRLEPTRVGKAPPRHSAGPQRLRLRRNGMNFLVPLLALALTVPMGYVLRPDGGTVSVKTSGGVSMRPELVSKPTTASIPSAAASTPTIAAPLGRDDAYTFQVVDALGRPSRFDPCRPIRYVVNPTGAPANWLDALTVAVHEVSSATGMTFEDIGILTNETITPKRGDSSDGPFRPPFQPERYSSNDWAPILIAWVDPHVLLDPSALGQNEMMYGENADGALVNRTGTVLISTDSPSTFLKGILMHELAHLLGLGHVTEPSQVMLPAEQVPTSKWGAGDLTGLRKVGLEAGCLETPTPP